MSLATQEVVVLDEDQDENGIQPETEIKTFQNLNVLSKINPRARANYEGSNILTC